MMKYREIKSAIEKLLVEGSAGRFRVVGYQQANAGASELAESMGSVVVYYSSGEFPKNASGYTGPIAHDPTYRIELTVVAASIGDTDTLGDANASLAEMDIALDGIQSASRVADEALDELFDSVFAILMDARNVDVGMPRGEAASRWLSQNRKDNPSQHGEYVVLTSSAIFQLRTSEEISGESIQAGNVIETKIDIPSDNVEQAAVIANSI